MCQLKTEELQYGNVAELKQLMGYSCHILCIYMYTSEWPFYLLNSCFEGVPTKLQFGRLLYMSHFISPGGSVLLENPYFTSVCLRTHTECKRKVYMYMYGLVLDEYDFKLSETVQRTRCIDVVMRELD